RRELWTKIFKIGLFWRPNMGVDFFPCDYCGESICDCGSYEQCNDHCYRRWCSKVCAASDGYLDAEEYYDRSCSYCRLEEARDEQLFKFLLEKNNWKRED